MAGMSKDPFQTNESLQRGKLHRSAMCLVAFLLIVILVVAKTPISSEKSSRTSFFDVSSIESTNAQELYKLKLTPKNSIELKDRSSSQSKKIHGRFLHITDIHPDPYYKEGSSISKLCHRGKGKAGKYGEALSGCDSPMILMDETIKWINENLRDKIDFIVWTGDNVRHDNDRNIPRTESNIFDMNEKVSKLMYDTFRSPKGDNPRKMDVHLIPSLGNNDVYPHNLFAPGPTLQTRELWKIWQNYIPQSQLHLFMRGAYFFEELIPNKLAVLSINTLYLFQGNPLVDNCDSRKQPGYKLFEWLGFVLEELRERNMKVWITGHVPPNFKNYDLSCLRKYIVWIYEYRDIVVGGLYGHMNLDHFIPLDSVMAYKSIENSYSRLGLNYDLAKDYYYASDDIESNRSLADLYPYEEDGSDFYFKISNELDQTIYDDYEENKADAAAAASREVRAEGGSPRGKVDYMDLLRSKLYSKIKPKKKSGNDSSRYSITHVTASVIPTFNPGLRVWEYNITGLEDVINTSQTHVPWDQFFSNLKAKFLAEDKGDELDFFSDELSLKDRVTILKKDKTFPPKMPLNLPLGPAYTPQLFSPERYVQYFANLSAINAGDKKFQYEVEYHTDDDVYNMKSLLVSDWLELGRKLGKPIKDKKKVKGDVRVDDDAGVEEDYMNDKDELTHDSDEEIVTLSDKTKPKKKKHKKKKNDELSKLWDVFLARTFVSTGYEYLND